MARAALGSAMVAATVPVAVIAAAMGLAAATTAAGFLRTAAGGQLGSGSRIGLHIVSIVAQLADILAQLVRIGLLGIVVNGQLGRFHVIGIGFDPFEVGHILFKSVGALLANAVGLDGHGLLVLGGRSVLLRTHAQRDKAH